MPSHRSRRIWPGRIASAAPIGALASHLRHAGFDKATVRTKTVR